MKYLITFVLCALLGACSQHRGLKEIAVGTIAGPETQLMQVAAKVARQRYGLKVDIVTFSDYVLPNQALHDHDIDANAFQHLPYLVAQNKARGFHLVSVGKTLLEPMGIYSSHLKKLSALKKSAKVAIPNDPSNEARALLLLQKAGLIKLKDRKTFDITLADIVKNPLNLQWVVMDAAGLPRALPDVSLAVINTNYALAAHLSLKDALFKESTDTPYVNIIATTPDKAHSKKVLELVQAYHSVAVAKAIQQLFAGSAVMGWRS